MTIVISLLLIISLTATGIMIWYTKALTRKLYETYKNIDEFQEYLNGYNKNLESVFELTDYYGDQTIKSMIDDTKSVIEACQNFKVSVLNEDTEQKNETKTE